MRFQDSDAVLFRTTFPTTPSGKIELYSAVLEKTYGLPLPRYKAVVSPCPLTLLTASSDRRITSTFGNLAYSDEVWLEMHSQDAGARGLGEGRLVRIWNDLGEVHLRLRLTADIRPGVVCSPQGAWLRTSDHGQTVSALAPSHYADLCQGACFNDTRVEVAAMAEKAL